MTELKTGITVTVRYFAAAGAAAGVPEEAVTVAAESTVADLLTMLCERNSDLAQVLARCAFLCDGLAVRDHDRPLTSVRTLDVLPPFAGG